MQMDELMQQLGALQGQLTAIAAQNTQQLRQAEARAAEQLRQAEAQSQALLDIRIAQTKQLTHHEHIVDKLTTLEKKQDSTGTRVAALEVGAARYGAVAGTLGGIGITLLAESARWLFRMKGG